MKHYAASSFWRAYRQLPQVLQERADRQFALLKSNPSHPSLQLKKVGRYWSVRVSLSVRALAVPVEDGLLWFWIGQHTDYERLIGQKRT